MQKHPLYRDYPKLIDIKALDDHMLLLTYEDGKRLYDFKPHLSHKYFAPLTNVHLFKTVRVDGGHPVWAQEQDFCPHTMYDDSKVYDIINLDLQQG